MKKIIFFHLFNDRSGSPKVLSQVITALRKNGFATETVTSHHKDGFLSNISEVQRTIFYKRSENKYITFFFYLLSQLHLFFTSFRYMNDDVVFYINTMMPAGAALAAKIMRKPVYYHVHETSIRPIAFKNLLKKCIEVTATKVIYVSHFLKNAESLNCPHQHVIYNSTDISFLPGREPSGYKSTFNVLMLCSLKWYKGVREFLEIAEISLNEQHLRFTLVLNASDDEITAYLREVAIPTNVEIHPRQSDVSSFYAQSDLLLNLSRPDQWVETFGLTILEAMSCGLPVIVPPVGGPSEIVRNATEGYLVSCYDTNKIALLIHNLSQYPELYRELSINATNRSRDFDPAMFESEICGILCS